MFDLIIRNGRIIDGTGAPWIHADIGVRGARIGAVGNLANAEADKTIDARGLVVCPGIVDIHSHSDWTLGFYPAAESTLRQGVTTEVVGQCGMSVFPVNERNQARVSGLLWKANPDDRPTWRTIADWFDTIEAAQPAINVAALVGHGTLRSAVIGDASRYTEPHEIQAMVRLLEEALDQGAAGLSSGLEYLPANMTSTEELIELNRVVARYGRLYATHMRDRGFWFLESVQECIHISEVTGVALQCSHMGAKPGPGDRDLVQQTAQNMLLDARNRGVDILADVNHVYQWGNGGLLPFLPPWVTAEGIAKAHDYLRDPEARARIKADFDRYWLHPREGRWDDIRLRRARSSPQWENMTIGEIMRQTGRDGYDVILDILDADPEMEAMANGLEYTLETVRLQATSPLFAIASDTTTLPSSGPLASYAAHPHHFGWVPHVLARWVRERKWLTLEEAIRKMTSFPAWRAGIRERGLIRPGMYADLMVFDELKVQDTSTFEEPVSLPIGIHHVVVNGQLAVYHGELTGVRAGMVLRF
ncbi:MAG: N-acyl-D-amino-acid deacylase family protein [Anaerolineae bacterium]